MSLLEIKNQVIETIIRNGRFEASDFSKIKIEDGMKEAKDSLIFEALKDLEEAKFVRGAAVPLNSALKNFWVLEVPVGFHGQEVSIGLQTANLISSIVNRYREANGIKDNYCNILAIDEEDLQNLCGIAMELLNGKT